MLNMNIEWDNQAAKGYTRHAPVAEPKSFLGGLLTLNKKEEEDRRRGHVSRSSSSSRPATRRAETISVLPPGVKMPTGNQPEVSYGADGSKYLVIPRRSNSSSRPRQIIVTSGGHASPSPRRMDSSGSTSRHETRSPPHRSSSTSRPLSPPHRAPKIVGDPELVKQYEHSQRNVARWVETVSSPTSGRPTPSKRNTTR